MDSFLQGIGMLAIFFIIAYGYKKILEHYDQLKSYEDNKVYRAAEAFSNGVPCRDVENILSDSDCLYGREAHEVVSQALAHRSDTDGGYQAFLSAVNQMIGENVYSAQRHSANRAL